ncbi:hypothetical protein BKA82DRAFT_3925423, partial [Pisolithus tinctorius]
CSKCHRPWLCSEHCKNKWDYRGHAFKCAIDTANYLIQACWTDWLNDLEDTKEDFGFTKFALAYNSTKLFGLYSFLVYFLEVRSQELHKWQIKGTLTENIIAKHETMTNYTPGAYYAWFCWNLHIFNLQGGP